MIRLLTLCLVSLVINHMRHLFMTALLLAAALALTIPAAAELTDAEKAGIKNLVESSRNLRNGERYLIRSIGCCSTLEARPALHAALYLFYRTQTEHWHVLAHLLHVGPDNPTPKPEWTDAEWRASAWFYLDRYRWQLGAIQTALTNAKAYHVDNAVYQDNLRRARDIWVQNASKLSALDPGLLYLDPWPELLPGKTIQTVVGPHGDYRQMQHFIARGKNYALDAYGPLIALYLKGPATVGGVDGDMVRNAWLNSSNMLDVLDRATALLADVPLTAEEASEDRFCRTLRVGKLLTVSAPAWYQRWGNIVADMIPPQYRGIVAKLVDSWKHVDWSMWQSLVFPESARCTSPFLKN